MRCLRSRRCATSICSVNRLSVAALASVTWLLVACGTTPPPPREQLTAASLAVQEAEEADAATLAPELLLQAHEKLARAQETEDPVRARRLAQQALIDAQLAEARARAAIAQRNLDEVRESLAGLQQPIELPPGQF